MACAPIHPGEHLAEELREFGLSTAEFAWMNFRQLYELRLGESEVWRKWQNFCAAPVGRLAQSLNPSRFENTIAIC
jgi:plasmid maintenance system antidote protein VapI